MKNIFKLLLAIVMVTTLNADSSRAEKWEFFFTPMYSNSNNIHFDGGSEVDISSRGSFGFGFGYNIDEHIELALLFTSSSSSYKGTVVTEDGDKENINSNIYMSSFNLAATYNFIDGPFTPYVTGTFGNTFVDSGIPTGDFGNVCYWDPWYGYICRPYASTYTGNKLNYGGSIGVRYDLENMLYFKAGIGKNWIDFDNSSSNDFTIYDITIGTTF